MKIQVEDTALDAIAAMAQKLQEERDELLAAGKLAYEALNYLGLLRCCIPDAEWVRSGAGEASGYLQEALAKSTAEPDIMEKKR